MRLHGSMLKWPHFGPIWKLDGTTHTTEALEGLGSRSHGPWLGRGHGLKCRNGLGRSGRGRGQGIQIGEGEGGDLLTCQLVSGRPEICIRNMVRRGRGAIGRSDATPGKVSLRRGPRANCTVNLSPLKSLPSVDGW